MKAQPMRQAYDYWQELPSQETCCFARNLKKALFAPKMLGRAPYLCFRRNRAPDRGLKTTLWRILWRSFVVGFRV